MAQDVRQWLTEIKDLQQQLEVVQQEREQAYTAAANWRTLYETEARQRRGEAEQARETIAMLQTQLQNRQQAISEFSERSELPELAELADDVKTTYLQRLEQGQKDENLQQQLVQAWFQIDRLIQALAIEQAAHIQTRHDLMTALGDAIRLVSKERADTSATQSKFGVHSGNSLGKSPGVPATEAAPTTAQPEFDAAKTPSLQLLQLDPVQPRS